jgi:hypothetical protein
MPTPPPPPIADGAFSNTNNSVFTPKAVVLVGFCVGFGMASLSCAVTAFATSVRDNVCIIVLEGDFYALSAVYTLEKLESNIGDGDCGRWVSVCGS